MVDVKRNIYHKALNLLKNFPAVAIIGPRQSGKTYLSKKLRPKWKYIDLEAPQSYENISSDPKFFLDKNPSNIILDEAQTYLKIINTLRGVINEKRKENNRFIITGSSSPEILQVPVGFI